MGEDKVKEEFYKLVEYISKYPSVKEVSVDTEDFVIKIRAKFIDAKRFLEYIQEYKNTGFVLESMTIEPEARLLDGSRLEVLLSVTLEFV